MYHIALQRLALQDSQNAVLQTVETICDQFQMENHFGTLSTALHEILNLLSCYATNSDPLLTVNFYVETEKIAVQILNFPALSAVKDCLAAASLDDTDTTAFTATLLLDTIEFRENELWLEMAAAPILDQPDRAEIFQQQSQNQQYSRKMSTNF